MDQNRNKVKGYETVKRKKNAEIVMKISELKQEATKSTDLNMIHRNQQYQFAKIYKHTNSLHSLQA